MKQSTKNRKGLQVQSLPRLLKKAQNLKLLALVLIGMIGVATEVANQMQGRTIDLSRVQLPEQALHLPDQVKTAAAKAKASERCCSRSCLG